MEKAKRIIAITGVFVFLFFSVNMLGNNYQSGGSNSSQTSSKSVQTKTTSAQTVSRPVQSKTTSAQSGSKSTKPKPNPVPKSTTPEQVKKSKDSGTVMIGTQAWAVTNLNVSTFRSGDTIPEARTNEEWVTAGESGKPAWCYYNNNPANGLKCGKLYNWYAVNDPRGLAPEGWRLPSDADWSKLAYFFGGPDAAGGKLKSSNGWVDGYNGDNESGFNGPPGGYRIENGIFKNSGSIGTWWSSTENMSISAIDFYLSQRQGLGRSSNPKQRGESVRCLKK